MPTVCHLIRNGWIEHGANSRFVYPKSSPYFLNVETQNAVSWGGDPADPWNSQHFLDLAELTQAYALAYDWLYDQWTPDQRDTIRGNIITYGLTFGQAAYTGDAFWKTVNGNWNCGTFYI